MEFPEALAVVTGCAEPGVAIRTYLVIGFHAMATGWTIACLFDFPKKSFLTQCPFVGFL